MMGTKERTFQPLPNDISLEDLVPEDNFYRRLQEGLTPWLLHPLRRRRRKGEDHPQRTRDSLRGYREPTDARLTLA